MAEDKDPFAEFGGSTSQEETQDLFADFGGSALRKKPLSQEPKSSSKPSHTGGLTDQRSLLSGQKVTAPLILTPEKQQEYRKAQKYVKPATKPKTLTEAVEDDNNYLGALWNQVVGSVSEAGSGLMGLATKAVYQRNPIAMYENILNSVYGKVAESRGEKYEPVRFLSLEGDLEKATEAGEEVQGQIKSVFNTIRPSEATQKYGEKLQAGFDVTDGLDVNDAKALPVMLTRLGADIGVAIPTGGLSFIGQQYQQGLDDYDRAVKESGVEPNERVRELFGVGYMAVNATMDKLGFDLIVKNNPVSKAVKNSILKAGAKELAKAEGKITSELIEKTFQDISRKTFNKVKSSGVRAAIAGLGEGATETVQGGASDALRLLTNKVSEEEVFDADKLKSDFIANRINDFAGGAVLGSIAGGVSHGVRSTDSYVAERVAESTTPQEIENLKAEIISEADLGNLDADRATEIVQSIDKYSKANQTLPQGLKTEKRAEALRLISERDALNEQKSLLSQQQQSLDPALAPDVQESINIVDNKVQQKNDAIREAATGEKYRYFADPEKEDKFYKQLGEGKPEEITPEYYELQRQDRTQEVRDNEKSQQEEYDEVRRIREVDEAIRTFQQNNPDIEVDYLEDLPDSIVRTFDRVEGNLPVDPTSLDETSNWLYEKYKQLTELKSDPNRRITIEQINGIQEQLGEDISTLENYKQQLRDGSESEPTASEPEIAEAKTINEQVQPETEANTVTDETLQRQPEQIENNESTKTMDYSKVNPETGDLRKESLLKSREQLGLPEIQLDETRSDELVNQEAERFIKDGGDVFGLVDDLISGKRTTVEDKDVAILTKTLAEKNTAYEKTKGKLLNAVRDGNQRAIDEAIAEKDALVKQISDIQTAGRKASRAQARGLRQFSVSRVQDNSLSGFLERAIRNNDNKALSPEQIQRAEEAHGEYERLWTESQAKLAEVEERLAKIEQEYAILRLKKQSDAERSRQRKSLSNQERISQIREERKAILSDISKIAKEQRSKLNANPIAVEYFKPIAKLAKNYVEEGVVQLDELVSKIHADLKDHIEGVTERDVMDAISGYGREAALTKDGIRLQIEELKTQMRLIAAIEDAEAGLDRKSGTKKKEATERVKELRAQLRELTGNEIGLASLKTRLKNRIADLNKRINNGDFATIDKKTLELDEEAKKLRDEALKVKHDYVVETEKYKLANRPRRQKFVDDITNLVGLTKSLKATWDFSAPFRQGIVASVNHPIHALEAFRGMHKAAFNEEFFDRWRNDLEASPAFPLMEDSGLSLTTTKSAKVLAKEEDFTTNLAEKVPFVKGSERAYSFYLNYLRANVFLDAARELQDAGYTFDNNPNEFKSIARVINNETGRGGLGVLEKHSSLAGNILWSPRLMASRINTFTSIFDPSYSANARKKAAIDLLRFMGAVSSLLFLASANEDWDIEWNPLSSNFGKIKRGNTRYSVMGGMESYIVFMARMISGMTKDGKGKVKELGGSEYGSRSRGDIFETFSRGKANPILGTALNLAYEKDVVGNEYQPIDVADEVVPLVLPEIMDAYNAGGWSEVIKAVPATTYGIGVSRYDGKKKKGHQPSFWQSIYYKGREAFQE